MKVMVTGAFGNVGRSTIDALLAEGHCVRAFDLRTRTNRRAACGFGGRVEVAWGDVRDPRGLSRAAGGMDAVVHTAFVIPPESERRPEWAREINVGGTRNLVDALRRAPRAPRLVYTSSVSVTGPRGAADEPPITAAHPTRATDAYTAHKIETEAMVRASGLDWTILRLGAVLPMELPKRFHPMAFAIPEDQRIEVVHVRDVGLALARAVACDEAAGRILLIGGGERCRLRSRELRIRVGALVGLPDLPEAAFARRPYYTDWMDTDEAQRLLQFQRHDLDDYVAEMRLRVSPLVPAVMRLFGGWIARQLLAQSPYYCGSER